MIDIREKLAKKVHIYRGRRVEDGLWIYGMPIADNIIVPLGQEFFVGENSIYTNSFTAYIVDPDTVTVFTGLYDGTKWDSLDDKEKQNFFKWIQNKQNKQYKTLEDVAQFWVGYPIFEGDILKVGKMEVGEVFFEEGQFLLNVSTFEYIDSLPERYRGSIVVGNVFEGSKIEGKNEGKKIQLRLSETDTNGYLVNETVFTVKKEWLKTILGVDDDIQLDLSLASSGDWDATEILRAARSDIQVSGLEEYDESNIN